MREEAGTIHCVHQRTIAPTPTHAHPQHTVHPSSQFNHHRHLVFICSDTLPRPLAVTPTALFPDTVGFVMGDYDYLPLSPLPSFSSSATVSPLPLFLNSADCFCCHAILPSATTCGCYRAPPARYNYNHHDEPKNKKMKKPSTHHTPPTQCPSTSIFLTRLVYIPAWLPAQGHLCKEGAPGLVLVCIVNLAGQCKWYGSAVKVLTRRGVDEESKAEASTFLHLPLIPSMTGFSDLTMAAEWLARGVSKLTTTMADGEVVKILDSLQPAPDNADGSPSSYDRTDPFPRSHNSRCGSAESGCPVADEACRASVEELSLHADVHVVLHPTRRPEVEAMGESQGRRYAVLQPCVNYEVKLYGMESAGWVVADVVLLWSAAGGVDESDQRRIKRARLL